MANATIRVRGQAELVRAFGRIDKSLRQEVQRELAAAAEIVSDEARSRLAAYDTASAAGLRPRVRGASSFVEQRRRKVTGRRGDWGVLQMREALLPALSSKQDEVIDRVDEMLARLAGEAGF